MSKEAKKEVVVCDGKDKDNDTKTCKICSVYQGCQVDGNFLTFEGNTLISTAEQIDKNKIKLEIFQGDGDYQLCLIIDPNQRGRALRLKEDDEKYSFTVEQNSNLVKAIDSGESYKNVTQSKEFKDFVFKKKTKTGGKPEFYLYSYKPTKNGKSLVLAVNDKGHLRMASPPELPEADLLNDDDSKYLFRIVEVY